MGGDDEAALASHAGSWLELLVSELVHLRPNTQARQHLLPLLQHCQGYPLTSHAPGAGDQPDASDVLTLMGSLMEVRERGAGRGVPRGNAAPRLAEGGCFFALDSHSLCYEDHSKMSRIPESSSFFPLPRRPWLSWRCSAWWRC